MIFNDFLQSRGIDPATVLLMRHTPSEPMLRQALPTLARARTDLFNTYQQIQRPRTRSQLARAKCVASLLGIQAGEAEFVGLYRRGTVRMIGYDEYWKLEENRELRSFGLEGRTVDDPDHVWVDLVSIAAFEQWKGMTIEFPRTRCQMRWAAKWPLEILRSPSPINAAA